MNDLKLRWMQAGTGLVLGLFAACQSASSGALSEASSGGTAPEGETTTDNEETTGSGLGGQGGDGSPREYEPEAGSCGFEQPAFCDTFETGPHKLGVAGELDESRWRSMRGMPSLHPNLSEAFLVGPSYIGDCRADLNHTLVLPAQDAVICDPIPGIETRHLLTASGAQNYGLSTYRIRQPFDFEGRTGSVAFDVDLTAALLGGWPAVVLSADPTPAPSFNFPERGSGPKDGVAFEFYGAYCIDGETMMAQMFTYQGYVETKAEHFDCATPHVTTEPGKLSHVELLISEQHIELWASEPSPDGRTFPGFKRLYQTEHHLSFSRGYVALVVRNHATMKYGYGASWPVRWDNVGFDGPLIRGRREHSAAEPLDAVPFTDGCEVDGQCVWRGIVFAETEDDEGLCTSSCTSDVAGERVGYVLPRQDEAPVVMSFPDVNLKDVSAARLSLAVDYPWFEWNEVFPPPTALKLRYRVNQGPWHERAVSEEEVPAFAGDPDEGPGAGLLNQSIVLDLSELRDGTNQIEMTTDGTWTGEYRAAATAADLIFDLK